MPRTETLTRTLFKFDELSDDAKDKAIERLSDLNVDYDWWEFIYEDAATIGLEITEFDTYRGTIDGNLTESLLDCCKLIRRNHGKDCDTFKTAQSWLTDYIIAFKDWLAAQDGEDLDGGEVQLSRAGWLGGFVYTDEAADVERDFRKALLEDYLSMLCREYDYQTSREQIIESIEANEYEFAEDGKLA